MFYWEIVLLFIMFLIMRIRVFMIGESLIFSRGKVFWAIVFLYSLKRTWQWIYWNYWHYHLKLVTESCKDTNAVLIYLVWLIFDWFQEEVFLSFNLSSVSCMLFLGIQFVSNKLISLISSPNLAFHFSKSYWKFLYSLLHFHKLQTSHSFKLKWFFASIETEKVGRDTSS